MFSLTENDLYGFLNGLRAFLSSEQGSFKPLGAQALRRCKRRTTVGSVNIWGRNTMTTTLTFLIVYCTSFPLTITRSWGNPTGSGWYLIGASVELSNPYLSALRPKMEVVKREGLATCLSEDQKAPKTNSSCSAINTSTLPEPPSSICGSAATHASCSGI